jgi:uncharacterized membrane protein (DUF2068 family)
VRRDAELRSALILRIFAVERFLRGLVFAFIAFGIWRFKYSRSSIEHAFDRDYPEFRDLLHGLGYNINSSGGLVGLIRHTFTLDQRTLTWQVIEGVGLWLLKRWGEYFAMVATSAGIPYEIYELADKITVLRAAAFVINVALVVYLVVSKRLFGVRGGKRAYDARLRSESIMQAAIDAAAREPGQAGQVSQIPVPGSPGAGGAEPGAGEPPAAGPATAGRR